jgi:dTDP-4-dehydrorhamnose 3,5-epimerase
MAFSIESQHLNGLTVIRSDVFGDERGHFMEVFRSDSFSRLGLPTTFVQDNQSRSKKGVLRGLHFQWDPPQGKLVRVCLGKAFLGIVDIRKKSPTFGKWFGREISADSGFLVWVPPGFANGFCALSDVVDIHYKCTTFYNPASEGSIRWNDPDIGIRWPLEEPVLSPKDTKAISLREWLSRPHSETFTYNV